MSLTAVVLVVIDISEDVTVIVATHQTALTLPVMITVSLRLGTGPED